MTSREAPAPRIYLDHAATTELRPEVEEAMRQAERAASGNPSSLHAEGRRARDVLEGARDSIRRTLRAPDFEVVFTSGGTEADALAVLGSALARRRLRGSAGRVLTSAGEHAAVLGTGGLLECLGGRLVEVAVDGDGRADPERFRAALRADASVALVSLMTGSNEVGTLQPLVAVAHAAREHGVPVHTDAVQALGKEPLRLDELPVDLVTISAHKVYGPKGCGALLVRREISLDPIVRGGSQQHGLRGGTEPVAAAAGLARAVELAEAERPREAPRLRALTERLRQEIVRRFADASPNTPSHGALPHILNVSFPRVEGTALVRMLDHLGVALSTGSACASGAREASHALRAMGLPPERARGSVRFSLGRESTEASIREALERLAEALEALWKVAPA